MVRLHVVSGGVSASLDMLRNFSARSAVYPANDKGVRRREEAIWLKRPL